MNNVGKSYMFYVSHKFNYILQMKKNTQGNTSKLSKYLSLNYYNINLKMVSVSKRNFQPGKTAKMDSPSGKQP